MPCFDTTSFSFGRRADVAHPTAPATSEKKTFGIREMARDFGVTPRALRFYEAKGLLKPRKRGTTRFFTAADRTRLAAILEGKDLGFSLREIHAMIAALDGATGTIGTVLPADKIRSQVSRLEAQRVAIERSLANLHACMHAMGAGRPQAALDLGANAAIALEDIRS